MKIWDWAEANNIPSLASKAKGVALSHFQVLRHTEDFLQIPIERLTMMLGHELLQVGCFEVGAFALLPCITLFLRICLLPYQLVHLIF